LACSLAFSCASGARRPDPSELVDPSNATPLDAGAGIATPSSSACGNFCGETFLHEVTNPPNLYFLIDRSGSMRDIPAGASLNKYDMARKVLGELLKVIGHRVRYGATIFPANTDPTDPNYCGGGRDVFAPTLGGLPACDGTMDSVLSNFLKVLSGVVPGGATPTAAALADLRSEVEALDGDTYLVLLTDGAPNCNVDASCGADECQLNIEGASVGRQTCTPDFNCCDPNTGAAFSAGICVDVDATEQQLQRLAKHGIPTYVVGMPGAEPYAAVLNRLAVAGGTARDGTVSYYAVADQSELEGALYAIGTGVAIRCSIELDMPPDDPGQVNVYFDGELIPADPTDGWSWQGDTSIIVNGDACTRLTSGDVTDARAVFGCDTVVR
jgi:hypothetical protein